MGKCRNKLNVMLVLYSCSDSENIDCATPARASVFTHHNIIFTHQRTKFAMDKTSCVFFSDFISCNLFCCFYFLRYCK